MIGVIQLECERSENTEVNEEEGETEGMRNQHVHRHKVKA